MRYVLDCSYLDNESKRSLLLLEAQNLSFLTFIASTFGTSPYQALITRKENKQNYKDEKLSLSFELSPLVQLG